MFCLVDSIIFAGYSIVKVEHYLVFHFGKLKILKSGEYSAILCNKLECLLLVESCFLLLILPLEWSMVRCFI